MVEERQHILNLFIKQVVRCPYLYESEVLRLFIRPQIEVAKALTLLPTLSPTEMLERIFSYYQMTGTLSENLLQNLTNKLN